MSKEPPRDIGSFSNSDPSEELSRIVEKLDQLHRRGQEDEISRPLEKLKAAAEEVSNSSSGSWLGYHANVYYRDFRPPPPGLHFSQEWGIGGRLGGDWVECDPEEVKAEIHKRAGNPDLDPAHALDGEARRIFRGCQRELASILEVVPGGSDSTFLTELRAEADKLSPVTEGEFIGIFAPQKSISRDRRAAHQGHWTPPHISVLAEIYAIQTTMGIVDNLIDIVRQAQAHISRQRGPVPSQSTTRTRIFIGHGHSQAWLEVKDFLETRLGLSADEFNRVSTAGISTSERLETMLNTAGFAFLIMTGEDEQGDGKLRARENVVHEAGLFQGRLGFKKAIILLEDGCEEFSNIIGLGQIRFPKGSVKATFEEIREVLEREGILTG